jgi:hypothetical protein
MMFCANNRLRRGARLGQAPAAVCRDLLVVLLTAVACWPAPSLGDVGGNNWDLYRNHVPLQYYRLIRSHDDRVCQDIVRALNENASPESGTLYRPPKFLAWTPFHIPGDRSVSAEHVSWLKAPLLNDGRTVLVVKVTTWSASSAPERIGIFENPEDFTATHWPDAETLTRDPRIKWLWKDFLHRHFSSYSRNRPKFNEPIQRYEFFKEVNLGDEMEVNLISEEGRIYTVIRRPNTEDILVVSYSSDRDAAPECQLGPLNSLP